MKQEPLDQSSQSEFDALLAESINKQNSRRHYHSGHYS